jgi:3-oxoacyl-[acyl-carrier protein] reductase
VPVAIELTQKVIDPMIARKFGRIVNITSGTVKAPLVGLDLSSGARAGLTVFMAGVARSVASANVTINFMQPGALRHRAAQFQHRHQREEARHCLRAGQGRSDCEHPGKALRRP